MKQAALLLAFVAGAAGAIDPTPTAIAPFSSGTPDAAPAAPWRITRLPKVARETSYRLVNDDGTTVLRAEARGSMSGYSQAVHADPVATPILEWRWKVSGVLNGAKFGDRSADDFAARVYVLFDFDLARLPFATRLKIRLARAFYGEAVPAAGLCYVWDAKAAVGTAGWSPYTDRLRVIVVESGTARIGQWSTVRRNVAEDYRAAFGQDPPAISGVAIATDTDNTGEAVTAWYGDIRLLAAP